MTGGDLQNVPRDRKMASKINTETNEHLLEAVSQRNKACSGKVSFTKPEGLPFGKKLVKMLVLESRRLSTADIKNKNTQKTQCKTR